VRRDTVARVLLATHVALIAFATAAMVTILAGEFPVWMQGRYTPLVFDLGWRYTGQAYVVLGALAALAHAGPRFGWGRAMAVFVLASGVALSSELAGTNIGIPFGPYHYTEMLGFRVAGDVPYAIPLSWSYMLYCGLAMCARLLPVPAAEAGRWGWAAVSGLLLVAWDVPLEVHMTNVPPPHWVWDLHAMPAWVPAWLGRGVFYGMPLTNWVGWFVTATVIARLMLVLIPAARWQAHLGAAAFPLVLYAVNGLMPIATTARHGLWGAAILGTIAMGVPLALAARRAHSATRAGAPPAVPPQARA
jgi:putative membrane protein